MNKDDLRGIKRLVAGVKGLIAGVVRRGTLVSNNSTGGLQSVSASTTAGDLDDMVELFEQYGFTGAAPPGAEAIILSVGAERAHRVALNASVRKARPSDLAAGEVAVYHLNTNRLIFRTDLSVSIETVQGANITISPVGSIDIVQAPLTTVNLGSGGPAIARVGDSVEGVVPDISAMLAALDAFLLAPPAPDGGIALATALQEAITSSGRFEDAVITTGSSVGTCE